MGFQTRYQSRPERVQFLGRPNRFLATVRSSLQGRELLVHVPNPGRMEELLIPGVTEGSMVAVKPDPRRKTQFDLVAVRHGRTWVSIDARVANRLVGSVLDGQAIHSLRGASPWRREVTVGRHRFDFGRFGTENELIGLVEVKSSNLRVGTTALFPDAPTIRGTHHVRELARQARRGVDATVLFLVQRADVQRFTPNRYLDPGFGAAFDVARRAGVRVLAYTSRVSPGGIEWGRSIPVVDRISGERIL
ncbi:MAG: DNA/RNA nuclease SfsA [Thermoplasmata archaeon]